MKDELARLAPVTSQQTGQQTSASAVGRQTAPAPGQLMEEDAVIDSLSDRLFIYPSVRPQSAHLTSSCRSISPFV